MSNISVNENRVTVTCPSTSILKLDIHPEFGSGGGFLAHINVNLDKLTTYLNNLGLNPANDPAAYFDDEAGYDGWEFTGTYNGCPFSVYTRWTNLRVAGFDDSLDVEGLTEDLRKLSETL